MIEEATVDAYGESEQRFWTGETSQMTSGTLSVFAYLRFIHAEGRDAVVGEPREEVWYREAGETGRCP